MTVGVNKATIDGNGHVTLANPHNALQWGGKHTTKIASNNTSTNRPRAMKKGPGPHNAARGNLSPGKTQKGRLGLQKGRGGAGTGLSESRWPWRRLYSFGPVMQHRLGDGTDGEQPDGVCGDGNYRDAERHGQPRRGGRNQMALRLGHLRLRGQTQHLQIHRQRHPAAGLEPGSGRKKSSPASPPPPSTSSCWKRKTPTARK